MLAEIANHLFRVAYLIALTLVPKGLAPDPAPSDNLIFETAIAAVAIAALLAGVVKLKNELDTIAARVGAALVWLAVAVAMIATAHYRDDQGPLASGVIWPALPLWAGFAILAASSAERYLGGTIKNRRTAAVVFVLGLGSFQYLHGAAFLSSPEKMWKETLRKDAVNEAALRAIVQPLLRKYRYDDAKKLADRCLAVQADACGCLEVRAQIALRKLSDRCFAGAPDVCACVSPDVEATMRAQLVNDAQSDAQAALNACPERANSHAVMGEVQMVRGDVDQTEQQAKEALRLNPRLPYAHYVNALSLQGKGDYENAIASLRTVIAASGSRDARLLLGALLVLTDKLDEAERVIKPLVDSGPNDAVAAYNLALIADRKGNYNGARQGYLSALRIDPCYSSARYNLAYLTWNAGIREEAQHHARKFAELVGPQNPLVDKLGAIVGIDLRVPPVISEGRPR